MTLHQVLSGQRRATCTFLAGGLRLQYRPDCFWLGWRCNHQVPQGGAPAPVSCSSSCAGTSQELQCVQLSDGMTVTLPVSRVNIWDDVNTQLKMFHEESLTLQSHFFFSKSGFMFQTDSSLMISDGEASWGGCDAPKHKPVWHCLLLQHNQKTRWEHTKNWGEIL